MSYLLRGIDPALWQRVRRMAAHDGLTVRGLLLLLVAGYADGRIVLRAESKHRI